MPSPSKLFVPMEHRPVLPIRRREDSSSRDYEMVAWIIYWHWVEREARKHGVGLMEARQIVFSQGTLPRRHEHDFDKGEYWSTRDYLLEFMMQFEGWQMQPYDTSRMHDKDRRRGCPDWYNAYVLMSRRRPVSLDEFLGLLNYQSRGDFTSFLTVTNRWDDVKALVGDPIYGHECEFELVSKATSDAFHASEEARKAGLPEHIRALDRMVGEVGPTNYTIFYPYPPNQHHNVPNCLCLLGDGGPIFRLQVLEPETCMQFELAELMPPWWGPYSFMKMPAPGEGQYDFPFPDFDITPGDRFDYKRLKEVIQRGCQQIRGRRRKWGLP